MRSTLLLASLAGLAAAAPNFVWLISEDNSMHYYKHFFEGGAETPTIAKLAQEGVTYTHAYSNAPVCSAARSALQTGVLGPKWGTQYHRAISKPTAPRGANMVHQYLRGAGYYVTNKKKTDYNFRTRNSQSWHRSSSRATWRDRPRNTPFFHMETFGQSHESSLHFKMRGYEGRLTAKNASQLAAISLPPYLPDTTMQRLFYSEYLDSINRMDSRVKNVVDMLEADGLLEDTFVFYFSDHGGVLPRSKGYLFDTGLHVPLVVRIPENYRDSVAEVLGSTVTGTVQFVDFAPTLLELAGLRVPRRMDGKAFLSLSGRTDVDSRDESYGYADRMDQKYDMVRSLQKGRYHYIRNYEPHLPNGMFTSYRYKSLAYKQWWDMNMAGNLTGAPAAFFQRKPLEMLFDTDSDPHEVDNLAGKPEFESVLLDMRQRLNAKAASIPDVGFYPESFLISNNFANSLKNTEKIQELVDLSALQLMPWLSVRRRVVAAVRSSDPMVKMWGYRVASAFVNKEALLEDAESDIADTSLPPSVRVHALYYVGIQGSVDPQPHLRNIVNTYPETAVVLEALNAAVYFNDYTSFKADASSLSPKRPASGHNDVRSRLRHLRN